MHFEHGYCHAKAIAMSENYLCELYRGSIICDNCGLSFQTLMVPAADCHVQDADPSLVARNKICLEVGVTIIMLRTGLGVYVRKTNQSHEYGSLHELQSKDRYR